MTFTLYAFQHPENSRATKVLAAAAFAGIKVEFKPAPMPPTEEFIKEFSPLGGSPVLVTPEGNLFETNAILRYIARVDTNKKLYGKTVFENSLVDAWLDFSLSEMDILGAHVVGAVLFGGKMPEDWFETTCGVMKGVESRLEGKTYLVGDDMTVADICIAFVLQIPYRLSGKGKELSEKFPNVWRMYSAVMSQQTTGEVLKGFGASWGLIEAATEEKKE